MAYLNRPRWVVAELDARGSIDQHAAMCLEHGVEGALASDAAEVVVDLRDLSSIDKAGLKLFTQMQAVCLAQGVELDLLLPAGRGEHPGAGDLVEAACSPPTSVFVQVCVLKLSR